MKKRLALSRDKREIQRDVRPWKFLAAALMVLVSGVDGFAQKVPDFLRTDASPARIAAPEIQAKKGVEGQSTVSPVLSAITSAQENDKIVVTVSTKVPVEYKAFTLSQPRRLVVDFINAGVSLPSREVPVNLSYVKQIRVSRIEVEGVKVARLVFDLDDVKRVNHQIVKEGQTVKILFPASAQTSTAVAPSPSAHKTTQESRSAKVADTTAKKPGASSAAATPVKPEAKKAEASAKTAAQKAAAAIPTAQPTAVKATAPKSSQAATVTPKPAPKAEQSSPKAPASAKSASPSTTAPKPSPVEKTAPTTKATSAVAPKTGAEPASRTSPAKTSVSPRSDLAATKTSPAKRQPAEEPAAPPKVASASKPRAAASVRKATPPPAPAIEVAELTTPAARPGAGAPPAAESPKPATQAPSPTIAPQAPPPQVIPALPPQETRFGGAPLTLDLIDIPLIDFFRLMAEEGGINVVMDPEIRGTISIKVVKVPWDQILEAALVNNGLDKQIEGNLVRIAKKTTLQSEAKQREDLKKATLLAADVETRVKRLNYAKATTFVPALSEQKSVRGTVVVDERSNSLVLTDIPSYIDKMTKLVESLDIPQPQVEIEARIVSANKDFARDLGVQFGFVQGNLQRVSVGGPNTFGTIGGTRPSATPTTTYAAGNPSTGRGASGTAASSSAGVSTGTSTQNLGNFNVNLPSNLAFGGIGLSVGNILDTFLLDAAITAGENRGLAKLISQPKVTAQNNSSATITQGLRFPVQIVANNTISVQFQNAALTLTVTPQITYEGNIVLDLHVENNTPDFSRQVNGIPSIRTSESTTRVLVTDGGTTVIGGIIIESDSNTSDRVPGLSSLPGVGNLFKRTSLTKSSQEVLFFITPKVIK